MNKTMDIEIFADGNLTVHLHWRRLLQKRPQKTTRESDTSIPMSLATTWLPSLWNANKSNFGKF